MTVLTGITPAGLRRLYCDLHKTDSEIAEFFKVNRTTISHMRKSYNITTRKSIGEIGEEMAIKELKSRGYKARNMNEESKLSPFDILLEDQVRIEIKTSTLNDDDRFRFVLTEKEDNENVESETRIRLKNGRTKKIFRKTCDLIIFVGLESNGDCHFFIMEPSLIKDDMQTLNLPFNPFSKSKHNKHRENWDLVKKIVQCANTRL